MSSPFLHRLNGLAQHAMHCSHVALSLTRLHHVWQCLHSLKKDVWSASINHANLRIPLSLFQIKKCKRKRSSLNHGYSILSPSRIVKGDRGNISTSIVMGLVLIFIAGGTCVAYAFQIVATQQDAIYGAKTLANNAMGYSALLYGPGEIDRFELDRLARKSRVEIVDIDKSGWPMQVTVTVEPTNKQIPSWTKGWFRTSFQAIAVNPYLDPDSK